jgi:hypothetical protein
MDIYASKTFSVITKKWEFQQRQNGKVYSLASSGIKKINISV